MVEVRGDLDLHSSPVLRRALRRMTRRGARLIVVGLSRVQFMDSCGAATLVQTLREVRSTGGELRLAEPGGNVLEVIGVLKLHDVFGVFDSVEEACRN